MNAALTACAPSGESYGLSGSNEKGGSFVVHPVLREGATSDLIEPGEAKFSRRVPRGLGVRSGPRLPYHYLGWRRMTETFGEHLNSALWLTLSVGRHKLKQGLVT